MQVRRLICRNFRNLEAVDFEPGAGSGEMRANGTGMMTVLSGQLTVRSDGRDQVLRAGDTFFARPGRSYVATNVATTNARVVSTMTVASGVATEGAVR